MKVHEAHECCNQDIFARVFIFIPNNIKKLQLWF